MAGFNLLESLKKTKPQALKNINEPSDCKNSSDMAQKNILLLGKIDGEYMARFLSERIRDMGSATDQILKALRNLDNEDYRPIVERLGSFKNELEKIRADVVGGVNGANEPKKGHNNPG